MSISIMKDKIKYALHLILILLKETVHTSKFFVTILS